MAERKIKAWITVNGVHVPLYEGESKDDAVKRSIKQAQENRKKDDDQKEKDIAKNQSEKDKLNKANSLVDEQNKIIEKYGPKSKEYQDFKKKKDEFLGKNKESLSDAAAGKASDEARARKETASDYDKEFGTVGKVDINNAPSAQLMKRLNDLSLGDEPVGKFWDKSAELYSVYKQLYSVANQKDSGFKFTKQNEAAMYQYRRYYNDGDVPGWARGQFNEFAQWNRKWNRTELSPRGELELERRANKAVVSEYKRYQKFINTVPKSFAANYPNLSGSQLKAKYEEYLKKNRK